MLASNSCRATSISSAENTAVDTRSSATRARSRGRRLPSRIATLRLAGGEEVRLRTLWCHTREALRERPSLGGRRRFAGALEPELAHLAHERAVVDSRH